MKYSHVCRRAVLMLLGSTLVAAGACLRADEVKPQSERRAVAAKALSPAGFLLVSEGRVKPWHTVEPLDAVYTGDLLLALPGSGAALKTSNGHVELSLRGNLPRLSPYPVLESAVVLHENPAFDLDFTLEHGRVVVTNHREKGPAKVKVRAHKILWELTLAEPGSSIALELYGRMLQGVHFSKDPATAAQPAVQLDGWVLKGNVELKAGTRLHSLQAPPGPSFFSATPLAQDPGPTSKARLPGWAESSQPAPDAKIAARTATQLAEEVKAKGVYMPLRLLLEQSAHTGDPEQATIERSMAVYGLAAISELKQVIQVLTEGSSAALRETAIDALRHYIGRGPGKDIEIYQVLKENKSFTPGQAETFVQLLHSFGERELTQPETYETLIDYVKHDKLAIRELAKWHLSRAVPDGGTVKYDAGGPPDERERAYKEWKKRVPDGKLPLPRKQ